MARVSYRARKTFRAGPLFANVTAASVGKALAALTGGAGLVVALRSLVTGYGVKAGGVTHNLRRRTTAIDTPGWGGVLIEHEKPRRRPARRRRSGS